MAMRIASLPQERWKSNITEWNPCLDNKIKASRPVGRRRKRWEDEVNEFLRPEDTEETRSSDLKNNSTWKVEAKKKKEWKAREKAFSTRDSSKIEG